MRSPVTIHIFRRAMAIVALGVFLPTAAAFADDAVEDCMQQGYRPGTPGFFQCLQAALANQRASQGESLDLGEGGSTSHGNPDNAVTDYSGSSMDGATAPDPNILKQLNSGTKPKP
jgi:hypothetical protein